MPHEHTQAEALIRRLIEAMVDAPREVRVKPIVPEGSRDLNSRFVKWSVGVHTHDFGKLVGKLGAHKRALMLVVEAMGARADADWCLAPEPPNGQSVRKPKIPRATHFDASPCLQLICETLELIFEESAQVTVTQTFDGSLIVALLRITPRTPQDAGMLIQACEVEGEVITLLDALRIIFRAIGHQQGVAVKIGEA